MFGTDVITNEKHPSTSATGVGVGWGLTQPVARGERRGSAVHVTSPMAPSHVIFVSEGGGGDDHFSCVCFNHKRKNVFLTTRLRRGGSQK